MKKMLVIAMLLTLCASSAFAYSEDFSAFGNTTAGFGGQFNWVKGDSTTGQITIQNAMVRILGGDGERTVGNEVVVSGMSGIVYVDFDMLSSGVAGSTLWGFCVDDSTQTGFAGGNMARYYGTYGSARGRIDGAAATNDSGVLPAGWHHLGIVLNTTNGNADFNIDGGLLGSLNSGLTNKAVGRISFLRISNAGAAGQTMWLDNLRIDTTPIPEPASMLALLTGLVGIVGSARRRK